MDLRDFFHRRCSELLVMEREVWQLHSVMVQESGPSELRDWLDRQNAPKRQQISNLEQAVDNLGGILGTLEHPVIQAIRRMHRQFMEMNPPAVLASLNDGLEAAKLANMTLAAYDGLLAVARILGEEAIVRLLEENRHTEEEMRSSLEELLSRLFSDAGGQMKRAA